MNALFARALRSGLMASLLLISLPSNAQDAPPDEPASDVPADVADESAEADEARARELYENGAILFEEAQYEAAIRAWEESYRLSSQPLLLFNIASAWERLSDIDRTLEYLNQYRAYAPADERERLERRIRALENRLEEQRAEERAAQAAREAEPPAAQPSQVIIVQSEPETPRGLQIARWSLLGLGVAGLGTGATFAIISRNARNDAELGCSDAIGQRLCGLPASADIDAERSNALVADIAFAVGGAALVGSIVTFFLRGRAPEAGDVSVGPWMSPTTNGVVFSTSF